MVMLNLACSDAVKSSTVLRDVLDVTREITKLIKESTKREATFRNLKESQNLETSSPGIRVLCPKRWTVTADALQSVILNYKVLLGVWEESMEYVKVSEMKCRIRGVMTYVYKFDFLFGCLLGEQLLRHSDILSKALQTKSLSAAEGQKMALSTLKTLESLRTDAVLLLFYEEAKKKAADFDSDSSCMPLQRRPPKISVSPRHLRRFVQS